VHEDKVMELRLDDVLPNRFQPRIKFDEQKTNQLADSIKRHGVIQPILVREIGDKYEIIAGERRYKASVLAGKETIPAIVKNLNDQDSAEVALVENIQREDLSPIEEAVSYKKILDMGYLNQESLANKLGKTQSAISNKLRLLTLTEEIQEALLNNKISERHARSLLRIENKQTQQEIFNKIIEKRLTVRKTDEEINNLFNMGIVTENKTEEKNVMNDEKPVNLNIPSAPIIEEIEIFDDIEEENDEIVSSPLDEKGVAEPKENNINFKPGFLDIDKIEQTAEDINVVKEPTDMDNLLKADEKYDEEAAKLEESDDGPKVIEGKFFSFIEEAPQIESEEELDLGSSSLGFDTQTVGAETIVPKEPEPLKPVAQPELESFNTEKYIEPNYNVEGQLNQESLKANIAEPMISEPSEPKDFNEVINEIREVSKKIENYGFYVDLDELDFGDSYQIIFKINKN